MASAISDRRRLNRSASRPPMTPPMTAPIRTADTASSSVVLLSRKLPLSRFSAPLITPMSYPNNIPPSAATAATR